MKLEPSLDMGPSLQRLRGSNNPLVRNIAIHHSNHGLGHGHHHPQHHQDNKHQKQTQKEQRQQLQHEGYYALELKKNQEEIESSISNKKNKNGTSSNNPVIVRSTERVPSPVPFDEQQDEVDSTTMTSLRDAILDVSDDYDYNNDINDDHNNDDRHGAAATTRRSPTTTIIAQNQSFSSTSTSSSSSSAATSHSSSTSSSSVAQPPASQSPAPVPPRPPAESQWRKHGAARRLHLLEVDRQMGGQDFHISPVDCTVQRYFQVAHFALEQFHRLYQSGTQLEETYVMGHRIVSFLTDCLPQHPGLYRSVDVQKRARAELELLQQCLDDVALQIDEEVCNQFVADFDPAIDDDDDTSNDGSSDLDEAETVTSSISERPHPGSILTNGSSNNSVSSSKKAGGMKRVRFEDWNAFPSTVDDVLQLEGKSIVVAKENRNSVIDDRQREHHQNTSFESSSSSKTVGTTGTGSFDAFIRDDIHEQGPDDEIDEITLTRVTLSFEDGGDDIGSNDNNDRGVDVDDGDALASFPTSDQLVPYTPSRELMSVKLDFLERIAEEEVEYETDSDAVDSWAQNNEFSPRASTPSSSGDAPTCDPARIAFRNLMNRLPRDGRLLTSRPTPPTFGHTENRLRLHLEQEEQVEHEIQKYLDSDNDSDASEAFESLREKLKEGSTSSNGSICNSNSVGASDSSSLTSSQASSRPSSSSSSSTSTSCSTSIASSSAKTVSSSESEVSSASSLSDSPRSAFHSYGTKPVSSQVDGKNAPEDELAVSRIDEENKFWERDDWISFGSGDEGNFFQHS